MESNLINSIKALIESFGEDSQREGLIKTPERVLKSFQFLTSGYRQSVNEILNGALFDVEFNEMVVVKNIEFYSTCEHHLVPFFGKCHVAYIPNKKIVGLSKIPRIVEMFSRRLQVQERLTVDIAKCIDEVLKPQGVGVVIEAQHLCMMMRGVQKQNASATTSSLLGVFHDSPTRSEFFNLVKS